MNSNEADNMDWENHNMSPPRVRNRSTEVKTPETNMSDYTQRFFQEISPKTLEEVCQVAETVANEDSEDFPLSPIVGYSFSENSIDSSSSDSDAEEKMVLNKLNYMVFKTCTVIDTPKTKARERQRRKRRKLMLKEVSAESVDTAKNPLLGIENDNFDEICPGKSILSAGFSAASGKSIAVSTEAVEMAQKRLSDLKKDSTVNLLSGKSKSLVGFATASGKKLAISAESVGLENDQTDMLLPGKYKSSAGFATAGRKNVSVAEEALNKALELWMETEGEEHVLSDVSEDSGKNIAISTEAVDKAQRCLPDLGNDSTDDLWSGKRKSSAGFSTASGKNVAVSTEAVEKARKCLFELENKIEKCKPSAGFSTASGRNIAVSSEAVEKAQKGLFELENKTEKCRPSAGFSTASGRNIAVSSEAVEKAQKRLLELENDRADNSLSAKGKHLAGFSTASGKNIAVSSEAVEKAQKRLFDLENDRTDNSLAAKGKPSAGFSTASGKNVAVSSEAVEKAQKRLFDLENDRTDNSLSAKGKPSAGFSTASGKNVAVSSEAVEKAQKRLFDLENDRTDNSLSAKGKPLAGFSTASGKKLAISAESVEHAKKRLIGLENDKIDMLLPEKCMSPAGFSTVVGKNISLAEEALNKALELWMETEGEDDMFPDVFEDQSDDLSKEVMDSVSALFADEENERLNQSEENSEDGSTNSVPAVETIPIKICSIPSDKSAVSLVNVYIARIYPAIYNIEMNGKKVMLSQKQFEKQQRKIESDNQDVQERMLSEIEIEIKQQYAKKRSAKKSIPGILTKSILDKLSAGDILDLIEDSDDVSSIENMISLDKLNEVRQAKTQRDDSIRSEIQSQYEMRRRKLIAAQPSALVKMLVLDTLPSDNPTDEKNSAFISIWRPTEGIVSSIKEGDTFAISNLTHAASSFQMHNLNTTPRTQFQQTDLSTEQFNPIVRICYSIPNVLSPNFSPTFKEFDVVGLVVSVTPVALNGGQQIYISDEHKNFLSIRFWNSVQEQGLDDIIQPGNFVSICNLQWRESSPKSRIPESFVRQTTLFKLNPKEHILCVALSTLKKNIENPKGFASKAEMTLFNILSSRSFIGNTSMNNSFGKDTTMSPHTPTMPLGRGSIVNYQSNLTPTGAPGASKSLQKFQQLQTYGNPPPVGPLNAVKTPSINRKFIPPKRKIN